MSRRKEFLLGSSGAVCGQGKGSVAKGKEIENSWLCRLGSWLWALSVQSFDFWWVQVPAIYKMGRVILTSHDCCEN